MLKAPLALATSTAAIISLIWWSGIYLLYRQQVLDVAGDST